MQFRFVIEKKFGIPPLLVGIFAFLTIWLYTGYEYRLSKPEYFVQRIQKKVLAAEKISERLIEQSIAGFAKVGLKDGILKSGDEDSKLIPAGFTLLVSKSDSLVYWSDNTIPVPPGFFGQGKQAPGVVKLANGWYRISSKSDGDLTFWTFFLLRHEYPFQNDYLNNGFNPESGVPDRILISTEGKGFPVFSGDGKQLFLLSAEPGTERLAAGENLIMMLSLAGFLGLILFIYRLFCLLPSLSRRGRLLVLALTGFLVFMRCIQYYLRVPANLYKTTISGPELHASSIFMPSLGDFLINVMLLAFFAWIFYRHWQPRAISQKRQVIIRIARFLLSVFFVTGILVISAILIKDLVINSSFDINFRNISNFSIASLWGVLAVGFILTAVVLITERTLKNLFKTTPSVPSVLLIIFLLSVFATVILNNANKFRENEKRKVLAIKLAGRRNPVTEILYEKLERKILSDSVIQVSVKNDSLPHYLRKIYFTDYWNKFNIQVTVCSPERSLKVQPQGYEVNCIDYFQDNVALYGEATTSENLYFLDYGTGNENYLAIIPLAGSITGDETIIFIELNARTPYKDLGYPELLMDRQRTEMPDMAEYSYGFYREGHLVHAVGSFQYRMELVPNSDTTNQGIFFTSEGIDHYSYRINSKNLLIVSCSQATLLDYITPFSYLFILLILLTLIFYFIRNPRLFTGLSSMQLKDRLQALMVGILLVSFTIVGFISGYNIIRLNAVKNEVSLRERSFSVLVEMQHKYGQAESLRAIGAGEIDNLLIKFANVFFTDINIYNPEGQIIGSSRPQIFDEGLISDRMNAGAYYQLVQEKKSGLIQEEAIGGLSYSSAYLPFYNDRGTLLGYLNLPYFSRQDELKKEVSSFLVTVVNIYVLLVLAGIVIIFFIARYITSPLGVLAGKMARLQLGRTNEKIDWKRGDEIGKLVEEYNRMIDELERSAEMLARSEREGAWREMARQVAHEIKNPLTPMKLSIQYMQKAWTDKAPDREQRLERFSKILIEQIDTLSSIATEFSDFARMPDPVIEQVDLGEVIFSAISLYQELENIRFNYHAEEQSAIILADRKQMLRAFTNLLNNSVQAIGDRSGGSVSILLSKAGNSYSVSITDNGTGIAAEQANRIFQPNFTTKSGGMGLGLAIVKGIVQNTGGDITFAGSEAGYTTFIITIPGFTGTNLS